MKNKYIWPSVVQIALLFLPFYYLTYTTKYALFALIVSLAYIQYLYFIVDPNTIVPIPTYLNGVFRNIKKFSDIILIIIYIISLLIATINVTIKNTNISDFTFSYYLPRMFTYEEIILFIISILITSFLPGYAILRLIKPFSHSGAQGDSARVVVLSFILSITITILTVYHVELFNLTILYSVYIIIILNFIIMVTFSLVVIGRYKKTKTLGLSFSQQSTNTYVEIIKVLDILTILFVCLLVTFSMYTVFYSYYPFVRGDMWRHFEYTQFIIRFGISEYFNLYHYPPFFFIYLASVFVFCNFENMIAIQIAIAFLINVMSIFAFYSFASKIVKRNNILLSLIIWSTFSGFDWLYMIPQLFSFNVKSDSFLESLLIGSRKLLAGIVYPPGFFGFDHQLFVLSITTVLLLLSTFFEHESYSYNKLSKYGILSLVWLLGYLIHITEAVVFVLVFIPAMILFTNLDLVKIRTLIISLLIPSFFTYLTGYFLVTSISQYLIIYLFSLLIVASLKVNKILNKIIYRLYFLKSILKPVIWYFYFLSFIIVFYLYPSLPVNLFWFITPWFIYPQQLGVAGIFTLFFLTSRRKEFSMIERYLIGLIILLFLFGKFITIVNINFVFTEYYERRVLYLIFIPIAIFSARGITTLIYKLKISKHRFLKSTYRKYISVSFILALIFLSGVMSTLYSIELWRFATGPWAELNEKLTPEEIDGLNYLSRRIHNPVTILTPPRIVGSTSDEKVRLIGANVFPRTYQLSPFIAVRPETFFYFQNKLNIRYIFMTREDMSKLTPYQDNYLLNHLITHLPIVYSNREVTIYEVPPLYPPSDANFSVIIPINFKSTVDFYSLEMIALSGVRYSTYFMEDSAQFVKSDTILLPWDILENNTNTKIYISRYLHWVATGGKLIVLNTHGFGLFSQLLSIVNTSTSVIFDSICSNNLRLNLTSRYVTFKMKSLDPNVTILANYYNNDEKASPFIFKKTYGKGNILIMDILPIFSMLYTKKPNEKSELFIKIKNLLNFTNINFEHYSLFSTQYTTIPIIFSKYVDIKGSIKIKINTQTILLQNKSTEEFMKLNLSEHLLKYKDMNTSLSLITDHLIIYPNATGEYTYLLLPNGFNIILVKNEESNHTTMNLNNNAIHNRSFRNSEILDTTCVICKFNNTKILLKTPEIAVNGTVYVRKADLDKPYSLYVPANRVPMLFQGKIYLKFKFSDKYELYLKDLVFDGKVYARHKTSDIIKDNEQKICYIFITNLPNILQSPLHILLLVFDLILSIYFFILKKRNSRKIRRFYLKSAKVKEV